MAGTKMYCHQCQDITECSAIYVRKVSPDAPPGNNVYETDQPDLQWFRRGRECQTCGNKFFTAEIFEKFVEELIERRNIPENINPLSAQEPPKDRAIIVCPSCKTQIGFKNPLDGRFFLASCPRCQYKIDIRIRVLGATPYQILELEEDCSDEDIKMKIKKLRSLYTPDRMQQFGPEIQALATEMMQNFNVAYDELKRRRNI